MKVNSIGQTTTPQTFKTRSNTPQEPTKPMYRGLEQDTVSFNARLERPAQQAAKTIGWDVDQKLAELAKEIEQEGKMTEKAGQVATEVLDVVDYNGQKVLAKVFNPNPLPNKIDSELKKLQEQVKVLKKQYPEAYNEMVQKDLTEQKVVKQKTYYNNKGIPIHTNVGKTTKLPENKPSIVSRTTESLKRSLHEFPYKMSGREKI